MKNLYNCDICSSKYKCHVDRVCLQCGELKTSDKWCIKKSSGYCLDCIENHDFLSKMCIMRSEINV